MGRDLDGFCRRLVKKGMAGKASPGRIALEFVDYFALSTYPHLMELHQVLREAGVGELRAERLPSGLRGLHFSYGPDGGDPTILYEQEQWTGAQEHSILHEAYEIIQERLALLVPGY
ncbi:hypothetical protein HRbin23_01476 [bacterium HR23]|uniref:Uncharacterized protein n=1 Tax=uncultured prokaryote TaxID=198431 RepID=H5SLC9_9ZZZZ|nr:hypothetical protein HGMM_F46A05C04 [uncultured prokaryote]GBD11797.1 hypothetical protein HRbin23_01476 [bacterium HR23]